MPVLDMPLSKLLEYQGQNECPADLDAYWDEGIAEMEALGTDYELVPAMTFPNAECYHLYFTGVGGARIHAAFVKPANISKPIPGIVRFHGYAGYSGSFYSLLPWAAAGMCVAAIDCRGQNCGRSEDNAQVKGNTYHGLIIRGLDDDDPRKIHYRNVFLDCAQIARIVMAMDFVDETKVGAYGGSQGGGLTLACAALTPSLNRCAPQYPFLSDYRRVWDMDLAKDAYRELKEFFRNSDPLHVREVEIFTKLGYIDVHNMAHRIKARTRMYTGLQDNICPPSSQFAAFNRITAEKDYRIYPDFGHEGFPLHEDDVLKYMMEM